MSAASKEAISAANDVADALDANVFVYSGDIDYDGYGQLMQTLQPSSNQALRPNSIMYLTTNGGHANAAYQIARLLQRMSEKFYLCVPSYCKSAGTLIALGASEIYMSSASELGPLDAQLPQRNEIGRRRSGMLVRTALEGLADETRRVFEEVMLSITVKSKHSISFEVASGIAATIATGVMRPVYAQINPDVLGNDLRDLSIATAYGDRLVSHGGNATKQTVRKLVEDYPEHGFIIDAEEAASLFTVVKQVDEKMARLMFALGELVYVSRTPHFVERLDGPPEQEEDQENERESDAEPAESAGLDRGRKAKGRGHRKRKESAGGPSGDAKEGSSC